MNHEETQRRLDEFVDGGLPPAQSRLVEEHLALCPACRAELQRLGAILDEAMALCSREIAPGRDLWPGVLERIQRDLVSGVGKAERPTVAPSARPDSMRREGLWARLRPVIMDRRVSIPLVWSAAVVLIGVSLYAFLSRPKETLQVELDPTVAQSLDLLAAEATKARSDLSRVITARGEGLPAGGTARSDETRAKNDATEQFDNNLRLLDQAIRDSRSALEADPQNRGLQRSLLVVYQKQLDLLRWATRVMQQTS